MALSTTIPTAKAIPARLTTLSVRPKSVTIRNVPTALIGIARPITKVLRQLLRNNRSTIIARMPPTTTFCLTRPIDDFMYSVSS